MAPLKSTSPELTSHLAPWRSQSALKYFLVAEAAAIKERGLKSREIRYLPLAGLAAKAWPSLKRRSKTQRNIGTMKEQTTKVEDPAECQLLSSLLSKRVDEDDEG